MQVVYPYNPGLIIDRLPDQLFDELKEAIKRRRSECHTFDTFRKQKLQVLSIKEIDDAPYFEDIKVFVIDTFKNWCNAFDVRCNKFDIQAVWTNYMKSGEFAPMHKHYPALASFVIWVEIPYFRSEEQRYHYDGKELDHTNRNGAFEFLYSKYDGSLELNRMNLEKKDEGTIVMFPGNLMHCVYPFFSSDQERISVAGNFYSLDQRPVY